MIDAASPQTRDRTPLEEFEAALDWWRETGVDCTFADAPKGWLAAPEAEDAVAASPAPPPPAPPKPPKRSPIERALAVSDDLTRIGGARTNWPATLEDFHGWWLSEQSLAEIGAARRLPPRGKPGAQLMIVVAQPAPDDGEALLSGNAGKLLAAMLRAMAVLAEQTYFASALPAPSALPEWDVLAARGLGEVTHHHIALAAPQRVLVIGRALAPLFGIAPETSREPAMLDCGGKQIPLLLAADLAQIARSPARRRNFWTRWLEWTR